MEDVKTPPSFVKKKHSILGLLPLFKAVEMRGFDPELLLKKCGLDLASMTGAAIIDQEMELEIIADAIDMMDDPILGVKVGSQVSFISYGPYAMLLMSANTMLDSVKVGVEFQALSLLFSHMTMHMEKDYLEMRYTLPDVKGKLRDFVADRDLMGTYLFIKEFLAPEERQLLVAGSARPAPANGLYGEYKKYLDCQVEFDQPYNWFRMPRSALRREQKHHNSWAHKLYRVQAYELMRAFYPDSEDMLSRIKQIIAGYERSVPTVVDIANVIGVSERTIRRQLDEAGTSFRELIEAHRKQRALAMMAKKSVPVSEIADALGYSESASFLRAFKRWTGKTPKQYRAT